ncbi:MAG TPA: hypothetical protein VJN90_10350 [Candidatus Acidoferrales bacterium]|nr:hypothetical protein [Candidatus Acidoferrales bacterium]
MTMRSSNLRFFSSPSTPCRNILQSNREEAHGTLPPDSHSLYYLYLLLALPAIAFLVAILVPLLAIFLPVLLTVLPLVSALPALPALLSVLPAFTSVPMLALPVLLTFLSLAFVPAAVFLIPLLPVSSVLLTTLTSFLLLVLVALLQLSLGRFTSHVLSLTAKLALVPVVVGKTMNKCWEDARGLQ